jgi:riboflavin transporter FmnP
MKQKRISAKNIKPFFTTRTIVSLALLSAISVILSYLSFPLPLAPPFIKLDFSDFPALLAAFTLHPIAGVIVQFIKNAIGALSSSSGGVGELANFAVGAAMAFSAGMIYKKFNTIKGALIALLSGSVIMAIASCVVNYYVIFPLYTAFMLMPMDAIINAFSAIIPIVKTKFDAIVFSMLPFNLIKGLIISAMTFFLYKRLKPLMRGN